MVFSHPHLSERETSIHMFKSSQLPLRIWKGVCRASITAFSHKLCVLDLPVAALSVDPFGVGDCMPSRIVPSVPRFRNIPS